MNREVLMEAHKHGTGGSQIGQVCGFSQWGGPFDVANEILNKVEKPVTPAMDRGIRLEPVIADMYFDRHRDEGIRLREPRKPQFSRKYPHALGSYDRLVLRSRERVRGLEVKAPGWRQAHNWGDPETDEIPEEVICQVQWYAGISGLAEWDVVAWVDTLDYREYRIEFDEGFFVGMAEANEEFWEKYIIPGVLPDPLEAADPLEALKVTFPRSVRPLLNATPDFEALAESYRLALARVVSHQEVADGFEADIKTLIADAEGVTGDFGKIYWRNQETKRVGWKAVAANYRALLDEVRTAAQETNDPNIPFALWKNSLDEIEAAHTKESTSRPFRKFFAQREDDPSKEKDNG